MCGSEVSEFPIIWQFSAPAPHHNRPRCCVVAVAVALSEFFSFFSFLNPHDHRRAAGGKMEMNVRKIAIGSILSQLFWQFVLC